MILAHVRNSWIFGASVGSAPWTPPKLCPGDLTALLQTPAGKRNDLRMRVHGMTSSLTPQTFGGGGSGGGGGERGSHEIFTNRKGDQQFFCFFQGDQQDHRQFFDEDYFYDCFQ